MSELEIWNELGNIYYNAGAYDEAIRAYHKAIEFDHGCGQSYSNLASIYIHKEYYAEAVLMFQKGIELQKDPKDKALLWNRMGDAYRKLNDYNGAIAAYQKAVELDPKNAALKIDLAMVKLDSLQGSSESDPKSQTSTVATGCSLKASPSSETPAAQLGQESKETLASDLAPTMVETGPDAPAVPLEPASRSEPETACWVFKNPEPDSLVEQGEKDPAEKSPLVLGSRVLSKEPDEGNSSEIDYQAGKPVGIETDQAANTPGQNISSGELDRAHAIFQLGLSHWRRGDYEKAIQSLKAAFDLAAGFDYNHFEAICLNAIAHVEMDLGNNDDAIQAFESATSLDPDHISPWNDLGTLYNRNGQYQEALVAFRKAIGINPKDFTSWNGLGDVYHKLGRSEDAISAYQLGNVFESQHDDEDDARLYQIAADTNQENPRVWEEMGNIDYDNGDYEDAIQAYARAIELVDNAIDQALLWKHTGDVYVRMADHGNAIAAYQKAVQLNPENPAFQDGLAKLEAGSTGLESESRSGSTNSQESTQIPEPCDTDSASSEPEETDVLETDPSSAVPAEEPEKIPAVSPLLSDTLDDPEPEAAYWVFNANTPAVKSSQAKVWSGTSPETAMGSVKPSPAFGLPQFTRPARLDDRLRISGDDTAVTVVEETPETEESARLEYVSPFITEDDQDDSLSVAEPETTAESHLESVKFTSPAPITDNPPNRATDNTEKNLHQLENDIAAYRKVTEINPRNDRAWDALGNMYEVVGLHNEAINAFEQAVSLASQREVYHYHLGLAHAAQKHYDKAIQALQKVVALNPDYMLAHCALAGYYRRVGKEVEAKEHIAIARPYIASENEYNQACFESICGNTDRAIALLKTALEKKQVQLDLVRNDPDLDFIRTDPHFEELVAKN